MAGWLRVPVAAVAVAAVLASGAARADEGWTIDRFAATYQIDPNGRIAVVEVIDVDFRGLSRHGIYRDIVARQEFDATRLRAYGIDLDGVTDASGRRVRASESNRGAMRRFKIGDPDRTVTGRQRYRIAYTLDGAFNGFADHDELYWNATGDEWPVGMTAASVVVHAPPGSLQRVECFEGHRGSTRPCRAAMAGDTATFEATRPLAPGEQLTVVTGLRKGAVAHVAPVLVEKPHDVLHFFERPPGMIAGMLAGFLLAINFVGVLWWSAGRDRRFIALQHDPALTAVERVPLFDDRPIGVEFQPPAQLRPAQLGLLLDERADTLDVSATIVDLAVRGYLTIEELGKNWWFSRRDWRLRRTKTGGPELLGYERIVLSGLFPHGDTTKLSDLRNKFYKDLQRAKKALYKDAVERGWFPANPETIRRLSRVAGVLLLGAGVFAVIYLGRHWGAGLLGLPVVAAGAFFVVMARAMPRRTPQGVDLLQRTLGFVRYVKTAETRQQAFAERANLFTEYLPYAVVFRCVDKWARAFSALDLQAATAGWYTGSSSFDARSFSSTLGSFSSSVSSAIASTPGGSGGSGFGGSSGGGGGGGGGGSW